MLFALTTLATADALIIAEDMICMEVQATSPQHGDQDVALDHNPAALLQGGCTNQPVVLELFLGDELVAEGQERVDGESLVELSHPLEPDTTYTFVVTPEGSSAAVVEFTTGSRHVEHPDLDAPALHAVDMDHDRRGEWISVEADVDLLDDPEGPFFVELVDEEGVLWGVSHHPDGGAALLSHGRTGEKPDAACLAVHQRAADGTRIASETLCDERPGCSSAGLAASLLPALMALAVLRRRGIMPS